MFNFINFINQVVAGEDPEAAAQQASQIQASEAGTTAVASDAVGEDASSHLPSLTEGHGIPAAASDSVDEAAAFYPLEAAEHDLPLESEAGSTSVASDAVGKTSRLNFLQ
jgi:hypothetical protein